jgi:phosphotransferase system enzyme I (PtsI)
VVDVDIPIPQDDLVLSKVAAEQHRYSAAVQTARRHLPQHVATVHGDPVPEAKAIFEVHQAILADESFHSKVRNRIAAERKRAEFCLDVEANSLILAFDGMRDPYFKARGEDIRDMACNLLAVLSKSEDDVHRPLAEEDVVLSRHLHSTHAIMAHRGHARAFASESRALASHAAILLKGFAIPSVGGVPNLFDVAQEGDRIIIDGSGGLVIVRPSSCTEREYGARKQAAEAPPFVGDVTPCITRDGIRIALKANVEHPDQIALMLAHGLDGIGLFRTEFMIPPMGRIPSEDEQYAIYCRVFQEASGRFITFRTFDIGADKQMGLSLACAGSNPALGVRGIRRHLMNELGELRAQLRAILRAAGNQDVGILFPMVTTRNDVTRAKRVLAEVGDELRAPGAGLPQNVVLGAMIEIPAAAISVQDILAEVEFISLGTNDLLQYFMAADRDNERVVQYNDATTPAFLWLLKHIIVQAAKVGRERDVTVCGEIASDARMLPHLLRLGYRSFSIAPVAANMVRDACGRARTR